MNTEKAAFGVVRTAMQSDSTTVGGYIMSFHLGDHRRVRAARSG